MSIDKIRIGVIGLGGRGYFLMKTLLSIKDAAVPAVCDAVPKRVEDALKDLKERVNGEYSVNGYLDYREMVEKENLDAVVIATTWITHIPLAIYCMKAGLKVGLEVGGATSIEECFDLVKASEETGNFTMLLENCCYDRKEMAALNMVKKGVFGEIVNLEGGYRHDLRSEIVLGRENIHGRLNNFMTRNGELYPTHSIGPIAKIIDINNGNRFLTLVSVSSKSRGLNEWIKTNKGEDYDLYGYDWKCGDVTTTIIKCANGETITLHHDCCCPRPYSREFTVEGVKGVFKEASDDHKALVYIDGLSKREQWEDWEENYSEIYEHPLWRDEYAKGFIEGHGGMDYLVLCAFVDSVKNNSRPPIDVYDAAAYMAVTPLSEQSVAEGGTVKSFPDFTRGKWIEKKKRVNSKYSLD